MCSELAITTQERNFECHYVEFAKTFIQWALVGKKASNS